MVGKIKTAPQNSALAKMVFLFEVTIFSEPVSPAFVAKDKKAPSRTIDMLGSQTLGALHQAIFIAFDREDPHMYQFQIGGKKPMDRKAVFYAWSQIMITLMRKMPEQALLPN